MGAGDGEEVETCRIRCGYSVSGDEMTGFRVSER